ncbi:metal dependent phosphohydrolase [Thalassoporum mexicanum PCC 7367]|uniref:HD domain-containing protein n=1 Tax=Thalassoporum mexicanum TaxID=3457544 RepID=UPI00029FC71D|nr:HD domain-containing protein [Pseudanabaena sp. PCC 7367]AFY70207.1 metal dependent phosphohydrolase [Pseudanabaena sp. PCC 7367]
MLPGKSRTYHDPLHGAITLNGDDPVEALIIRLIDAPEFQRLRRIRQLDTAFLTFHGAEGSRFTHSLGVMALTRRAFDGIADRYPLLRPHRVVVLVAALLHDLGHGPFSHAGEEILGNHHELWTVKLIHESSLTAILQGYSADLPDRLEQVFTKTYKLPIVHQLVSSQLDCDRLDYLQRDGYFTGARYGQLDLDRILMALNYDPITQRLVVDKKGTVAIEHYLTVRYFMYLQVYNHPKNIAARFILEQIYRRATNLLQTQHLAIDPVVKAWILQDPNRLSCANYLAADDIVFGYHVHRWRDSGDRILMDMCRRYLDRDLFRTIDISDKAPAEQAELLEQVQNRLRHKGVDPQYYCGIRVAQTKGYTIYQQGIEIQTQEGLQDIVELSALVKTLSRPIEKTLLLYPKRTINRAMLRLN